MDSNFAAMGLPAMFENKNALPSAESGLGGHDRDGQLNLRKGRPEMRGHVVRTLIVMQIARRILRGDGFEEPLQIRSNIPRRVLLDEKRRRGVPTEQRQQADLDILLGGPRPYLVGDLQKPSPGRQEAENRVGLVNPRLTTTIPVIVPNQKQWAARPGHLHLRAPVAAADYAR